MRGYEAVVASTVFDPGSMMERVGGVGLVAVVLAVIVLVVVVRVVFSVVRKAVALVVSLVVLVVLGGGAAVVATGNADAVLGFFAGVHGVLPWN